MTRAEAFEILASTPQKLAFLTAGLSDDQLRLQLLKGSWSMKQIIGHLCESEEKVFHVSLRRIKKEDNPSLERHDPDIWAKSFDDSAPLPGILARFQRMRLATIASLNKLPEEDLARTGVHPERGQVTMGDEIVYMAEHDLKHLSSLGTLRKTILGTGHGV